MRRIESTSLKALGKTETSMTTITQTAHWQWLKSQAAPIKTGLKPTKSSHFIPEACGISLDFNQQQLNSEILTGLLKLTKISHLDTQIEALFSGKTVNISENKPALHTALRAPASDVIMVDQQNIMQPIHQTRVNIGSIADKIRNQQWQTRNGLSITDIVNIGIGGSDLGPKFCVSALAEYTSTHLNTHFISDADPLYLQRTLTKLNPETTLLIICSKSFTTQETMLNARTAMQWIGEENIEQQVIAVTANIEAAIRYGIKIILPIWDWIGGRYSVCSAINLITAIAIGSKHFEAFLAGAHAMDQHFYHAPYSNNLPVLLALINIWNVNFLELNNRLMLTYSSRLSTFSNYVQQLEMESNGKSIDNAGNPVDYQTSPIIWGGCGNQAQHSYYQLLTQGTPGIPIDFITMTTPENEVLNAFCKAKMRTLSQGINGETTSRQNTIKGQVPFSHLTLSACTPATIGALLALYEHKVFVESVIWNINPFDQPGVDSAKSNQLKIKSEIATI